MAHSILERVFQQGFTLRQLRSRRDGVALPAYRYRFRTALRRFLARPSPQQIPRGPLVLLADGLWFDFAGRPWVLYLTALKSCTGTHAIFLDPRLFPDKEGASRWRQVVASLPPAIRQRVQGLVVDNLPGMQKLAAQHGRVLQLCHFHLLMKLQVRRSGVRYALRGGTVRAELDGLIRNAIVLPDGRRLDRTLLRLRRLAAGDCGTLRIQTTVREFLHRVMFYRAYLTYPQLDLPTTTNAVESMGRLVREMFRRNRAGSNPASLLRWATAFIRMRPRINCNGHPINRKT